ncbi:MAG: ATP-dependent DNA helicase [Salinisphaeraceae bacterium]|nr:ATP-dependent DNA helicase [Salinisphaeraceae bacterium]
MASRLLREQARQLGLEPNFSVMDRGDAEDLLDIARQQLKLAGKGRRFPRKQTCLSIYSRCINTRADLETVLGEAFPWCLPHADALKQLFAAYTMRKRELCTLDYDDLLLFWSLMMTRSANAQAVSARFDHVLVDEYQDTNTLQAAILRGLCPDGRGLSVVGDDAQSIYSFRAANVENILGFADDFPGARIIKLEQNYRSTPDILDAANAVIALAPRRHEKTLYSRRPGGVRPRYVTVPDAAAEARYVCEQVLARRETGVPLKRQAALFRNASHANDLEIELIRQDIPFRKYGGLKFLEAAHVKDFLALLRWASNPRHQMAAFRAMQLLEGIGPATAERGFEQLEAGNWSLTELRGFRPAGGGDGWSALVTLLCDISHPQSSWPDQLRPLGDWYLRQLDRLYESPVTARAGDIDDLMPIAATYPDRDRFLAELTLDPPVASGDLAGDPLLDEDYLVLSTVHSAKGQEWDSVHVLHVADGSFPNEFATRSDQETEEERRLLYVALTRAENHLHVLSPLRYYVPQQTRYGDRHVYGATSRFFPESVTQHFDMMAWGDNPPAAASPYGTGGVPDLDLYDAATALWD